MISYHINSNHYNSVAIHETTENLFSLNKVSTIIGLWESDWMDGTDTLISWKKAVMFFTKPEKSDIYFFISNSSDKSKIEWKGPYRNHEVFLTTYKERFIKLKAVISFSGENTTNYQYLSNLPAIHSISIQGVVTSSSSKFFTKTFNLGFSPEYLLMTSEMEIPQGAIIKFGVTNVDTINIDKYQMVEMGKITKLDKLSITGKKLKIVIELSGNSSEDVIVHEFATMFSGEKSKSLNS